MFAQPHYWQYEQTGRLAPAVGHYLNRKEPLTPEDVELLRIYLRQWALSPAWDLSPYADFRGACALAELRDMVEVLKTRKDIDLWTDRAVRLGIDPW